MGREDTKDNRRNSPATTGSGSASQPITSVCWSFSISRLKQAIDQIEDGLYNAFHSRREVWKLKVVFELDHASRLDLGKRNVTFSNAQQE